MVEGAVLRVMGVALVRGWVAAQVESCWEANRKAVGEVAFLGGRDEEVGR